MSKNLRHAFLAEKKRLRQPRRPPRTYYTSQHMQFLPKKRRLRQPGRLQQGNTYNRIKGTSFFQEKKAPAAAGKTSTELIHVIKSKERQIGRKKKRLRQRGRPEQSSPPKRKGQMTFPHVPFWKRNPMNIFLGFPTPC